MTEMRWKRAQRHFLFLVGTVIIMVMSVQLFFLPPLQRPPDFTARKVYLTSVCGDGRRLGNLMFNYASLIGIAQRYNMTPVLENDFSLFDMFELSAVRSMNLENTMGMYRQYEEYGKRACAYDVQTEHFPLPVMSTKLHGYFQSWKYFENAYQKVRNEFRFRSDILEAAKRFHTALNSRYEGGSVKNIDHVSSVVRVGIHVRRGDILEGHYSWYGYTTPDKGYYVRAMQLFQDKYRAVLFIVCSDDMVWSRDNIMGDNVVYSNSGSAAVDLAILSLCDHVIMSVGSFGWWAAWFANGTTVYYDNWPRPVSMLEYMVTKRDYFLPHWIALDERE